MAILKEMLQYANAIADGKRVACVHHRNAAVRFINDIKSQKNTGWLFDEEQAERFIDWCGLFKHSKGILAGQRKIPTDFEIFTFGNIYGFWDKDGNRRFTRSFIMLPRKQAKSQMMAIQTLYEISALGVPRAEAYIAATKREQTKYVWGEAAWLIANSDLKSAFTCKYSQEHLQKVIHHVKSDSYFMRLSKEDGKKGDGSNPSFAVLDEVHQMVDDSHYHLLLQGMATRKNTLLSMITTAGTSTDADNFCYREYQFACNLLNPHSPVTDDKYFAMICQLDTNLTSEIITTSDGRKIEPGGIIDLVGSDESILKTQVVTGLSETVRTNIADKIKDAQNKPENMKMLLTKTFNVFVTARGEHGFLDMSRWSNCAVNESELEDIINNKAQKKCFIGVDLSSKLSLSSVSFIFPYQDGNLTKYAITGHSFVPREEFTRKVNEGVPYDGFERRGDLTVIDGACIDHDAIHEYILGICREEGYQVQEICVDPWSAGAISSRLQNDGFEVVDIVQGLKTLSEPTKSFREMVYSNRIVHANNAVINYCMSNAIVKQDHNQNIMICKKTSKARVDALSATLNAMVRALTAEVSNQETMSFGVMFV